MQEDTIRLIAPEPATERRIRSALGTGQPLPASLRRRLEHLVGIDLGAVRLHLGGEANWLTDLLAADAVTVGADIFFRDGAYQPQTERGLALLGHELGHVLAAATSAPRPAGHPGPQRGGIRVDRSAAVERFADQVAAQIVRGLPRPPSDAMARPLLAQDELVLHCRSGGGRPWHATG